MTDIVYSPPLKSKFVIQFLFNYTSTSQLLCVTQIGPKAMFLIRLSAATRVVLLLMFYYQNIILLIVLSNQFSVFLATTLTIEDYVQFNKHYGAQQLICRISSTPSAKRSLVRGPPPFRVYRFDIRQLAVIVEFFLNWSASSPELAEVWC